MIEAFSLKTAHLFGDALASQARLRYRVFVERRALPHSFYDGMEYDEFDTPAAVYLVWRDNAGIVRGLIRTAPTSVPYMLQSYWPYLCQKGSLPKSATVWEMTRVCVDRDFEPALRKRIIPELLCGLQEFCLGCGVEAVVGVTRQHLLNHFLRRGVEWLGEVAEVEGEPEAAFRVPVQCLRPEAHCRQYGIAESVLSLEPRIEREAA
ncbi:MAG: acyl-homoserine-lactone synthase [Pseudolabrys sp.]